jgi:hypothetical protein
MGVAVDVQCRRVHETHTRTQDGTQVSLGTPGLDMWVYGSTGLRVYGSTGLTPALKTALVQGAFSVHTGNVQCVSRERSVRIQGTFLACPLHLHSNAFTSGWWRRESPDMVFLLSDGLENDTHVACR